MLYPLPKNVYSLCLVSTLAITTHPPRCCEDRARLVADKLANGKEPKDAQRRRPQRGCPPGGRAPSHYSGNCLIGFEHCGAHFFDLGGPSHYSGNYLIGFEHCAHAALPRGAMPAAQRARETRRAGRKMAFAIVLSNMKCACAASSASSRRHGPGARGPAARRTAAGGAQGRSSTFRHFRRRRAGLRFNI